MANNTQNSGNREKDFEEDVESTKSGDEGDEIRPEEKASTTDNKSKKRLSKESHIMSDSESEQDNDSDKKQDQESEKKQKKKKKIKLQENEFSPKQTRGKKAKVQTAAAKKGKKSPLTSKPKGKKGKVNMSQPVIKLPEDLLESPMIAAQIITPEFMIAAHMKAYTKWLLENDMLVSQQSLNQFAQPSGMDSSSQTNVNNQELSGASGFTRPAPLPSKNQSKEGRMNNLHDISTDESSNMDSSELDGQPPFLPKTASNANNSGGNLVSPPPTLKQW